MKSFLIGVAAALAFAGSAFALFNQKAGVKLVHVPYRGAPAAITDIAGG